MTYFLTKIKMVTDNHHVCDEVLATEIEYYICFMCCIILNYVIIISCLFTLVL